jgi:Uma2 family endonuclease
MVATRLITAEDFLRMPDDGHRYELIEGVVYRMPPAGDEHGVVTYELSRHIGNHVAANRLGRVYAAETGFVVSRGPDTVLGPDIMFVRADRLPPGRPGRGPLTTVPDHVVETVSPSDRDSKIKERVDRYLAAGVSTVWCLFPEESVVTIHRPNQPPLRLQAPDALDGGDILPGFCLSVAAIFDVS